MPKPKKLKAPFIIRKIAGHSMLPVLPPGTTIYGITWLRRPKANSVVIVKHEGREKIKRIQDIKDSEIYVVGDHDIGSTDSRNFGWISSDNIIARVVWPRTHKAD